MIFVGFPEFFTTFSFSEWAPEMRTCAVLTIGVFFLFCRSEGERLGHDERSASNDADMFGVCANS